MIDNKIVCDFCRRPVVVWRYPCSDFVILEYKWGSYGDWAACDNCASYIEKDNMDDLAFLISGMQVMPGLDPTFEQQTKHMVVYLNLLRLYDKFKSHRKGTRVLA